MICKEAIDLLAEYLESALTPETLADLERHLEDCAPCRAYLATYGKTRSLAAAAQRVPMPDEMKHRLREFLLAELRRHASAG